jgi:mediator of RNA polymerase II transcription subunit 13
METGEYETNSLLINNIASIAYYFFVPTADHWQIFPSIALNAESTLRSQKHLAWYDASRRGIWIFEIHFKEGAGREAHGVPQSIDCDGYMIELTEEGRLDPAAFQKNTSYTGPSGLTPTSSTTPRFAPEYQSNNSHLVPRYAASPGSSEQDGKASINGSDSKLGVNPKTVYDLFVAALLLTVSVGLCRNTDAIPLNYRTLLLASTAGDARVATDAFQTDRDWAIGSLQAYVTTTGTLVISIGVTSCDSLESLANAPIKQTHPMQSILSAPFGLLSHNSPHPAGDLGSSSLVNTPNPQSLSFRPASDLPHSRWKQACLRSLEDRGVSKFAIRNCSWVDLLVSKPKSSGKDVNGPSAVAVVPWPAPLCFRRRRIEVVSTSLVGHTILSGHEENHNPLGDASTWYHTNEEREERSSKRKAERNLTATAETNEAEVSVGKINGQSPMAMRRAMYPTPPDGIQQFNGITPSLDDTISSPANPAPTSAVIEMETVAQPDSANDDFGSSSGNTFHETRRERSDSNLLNDADNMFGDMGGDMFGDNDITEADFNFFDERPDGDGLDIPMMDHAPAEVTSAPAPTPAPAPATAAASLESSPAVAMETPRQVTDSAVAEFTKPELKHARSSLVDAGTSKSQNGKTIVPVKRESSPFNPQSVFKRVKASMAAPEPTVRPGDAGFGSRRKSFARIDLGSTLPNINKKYEQGGVFNFNKAANSEKPKLKPGQQVVPETDYLKRHGRHGLDRKARPLAVGALVKSLTELEVPSSNPSPQKIDLQESDSDDTSMDSDLDEAGINPTELGSPLKAHFKTTVVDDDAVSHATSIKDSDVFDEPDQQILVELPRALKPEMSEYAISRFFADPEPPGAEVGLGDHDLIQIAQILTEQAATGNLDICGLHREEAVAESATRMKRQFLASSARKSLHTLEGIVSSLFSTAATPTRLKALLDIQDIPQVGQPNRMQPRPIPGRDLSAELRPSNLYQIPGPHLEVRRAENKLSVLPSAIGFWESLGLAPSSGSKDVRAICLFPGWRGMAENVDTFLERLKSVYEMLKLGGFESMSLPGDLQDGILPYEVDRISTSPDATTTGHGSALVEGIETLRLAITELADTEKNVVIYFVYSPGNPRTVVEACVAFQRLFDQLSMRREVPQNELVLQLISVDFLSSPNSLVIPSPSDLMGLCVETYDRCTLFNGPMPAPAIRLEQSLPRGIDFKLTSSPSASLIQENSCIHVAYAQSVDNRWVTAAWTDDRGNQQATASYCLARRGHSFSRTPDEIAHEIWETTLDLIASCKVHWRILITKCSPMDQREIEFWLDLARTETKASVTLTLFTVDTAPSLQLVPPPVNLAPSSAAFYTTPVSTPQASIVSPEQSATPATPMRDTNAAGAATPGADGTAEADSDAVLIDVTDQTWGAIAGHRLGNPGLGMDSQAALLTGYLIKRTGNKMEDAPAVMEINLVHTESSPRVYENLMRETLSNFRQLGTLARARGVAERTIDVRPWHVAAAEKAVRALYLLM